MLGPMRHFAARRELGLVFDDLALNSGLDAQRLDTGTLLLDARGVFVQAEGWRHAGCRSCRFNVRGESVERVEQVRATVFRIVGDNRVRDQMFVIDWRFTGRRGEVCSSSFEELADDELLDEAYPMLGPLVRAILGALSRRKGDSAEVLYTADKVALQSDGLFVSFVAECRRDRRGLAAAGRCFATVPIRRSLPDGSRTATLAAVYRAFNTEKLS